MDMTVSPQQVKDNVDFDRHNICEFFNTDGTFELEREKLVDAFLVYKEEKIRGDGLSIAAAFVVFQVCDSFLVMVTALKVSKERVKSGYGTAFFRDVAVYIYE